MSHVFGKASSAKDKASNAFYRKIKPTMKDALTTSKVGADCRCAKCSKLDGNHRMKRLRTRKDRNKMRDGGKESSKAKSCHHLYSYQISKDVSHFHPCCRNTSATGTFSNVVPVTHEPSVITDSRLLGHHGLFNHEVKSIDIERLLSEQRKLDRYEKEAEKSNSSLHKSTCAADPPSNESQCLLDSGEEGKRFEEKNLPSTNIFNLPQEQDKKTVESNSQCSDLTPGQRSGKTHNSSTGTNTNDKSSKHTSSDAAVGEMSEAQPASFENNSESYQTPSSFIEKPTIILPGSVASFIERTPTKPASAATKTTQTQASHPSPQVPLSPAKPEASSNQDDSLVSVAASVKSIATRLCSSLSFPLMRNRNLVATCRDKLLKTLRHRHGPQLQRNILKIQQQLYSCVHEEEQGEVLEQCHIPEYADKDRSFLADEFTTQFKATTFATSSFEETERVNFDWNSTDWSNPLDQTGTWLGLPAENPIVTDDTFSRRCSPLFPIDFELTNSFSRERKHLFPLSPTSSCVDGPDSSGHVEDFFISAKGQDLVLPDSAKNYTSFPDMRTLRYRRSPRTRDVNDHHCSFDAHHSESVPFPQAHSSFEPDKYSYRNSISEEITNFHQGSKFEPFSHLSLPAAPPVLRNHHIDLANYPPSYMLERDPSLSTGSCFQSPEHWSFPPMRLY